MWLIVKYKPHQISILKNSIKKILGDEVKFYYPKINIKNYNYNKRKYNFCEKNILENYLMIFHNKLKDKFFLYKIKFAKGLNSILDNYYYCQNQIALFIKFCKKHENENGYLKPSFFDKEIEFTNTGKFVSGPLKNFFFKAISNDYNKIKVLINGVNITVTKKTGYLYRSI